MAEALPSRPSLAWLKKTAKQHLRELRAAKPASKLADAQLAVARRFGFSSWRALKAEIERPARAEDDERVATFLHDVGTGDIDAIKAMLTAFPDIVNAIGPHPFWGGRPQALHVAIEANRRGVFDLLLEAGADVNGSNVLYDHWSPLMLTYDRDRIDMRETLLARGARIGVVEALMAGDDAAVRSMLRAGKTSLPPDPNGGSILAFARTPYAIDRLLELGAAHDAKDRWSTTPIEAFSRLGRRGQPLVAHLLKHGVSAPPEVHARMGDKRTVEAMLAANPRLIESGELLLGAVDFAHHDLVQWLLAQGANSNARSGGGSQGTALHSAAWEGDLRMVRLLVEAGADLEARDREHNSTPEGWARVSLEVTNNARCLEVAEYLRQRSERPTGGASDSG